MTIRLHNTATGQKEEFSPRDPNRVTMYVCGPTVYDYVHIGNGRPAVVFDVLARLLRAQYKNLVYARNITDIDDKINARALAANEPIAALTELLTTAYEEDVASLGVLPPTVAPRATHHIPEILEMIQVLIDAGHAYAAEGHVLFAVNTDPDYGKLSNRSLEDMVDGARVEVAPYKKDPKDFVLWKPSSAELPGWDSPWGRGRPGWHIECSAMSLKHLDQEIDIHGGGSDLVFPHHENESAQSRCALKQDRFARFWLHNGMLTLGDEKMSKSVGNVRSIRDLLEHHRGETLRYALLSAQYRSSLAWSENLLQQAKSSLDRLYQALRSVPGEDTAQQYAESETYPSAVIDALEDDLNTPLALAALHELARQIHATDDIEHKRVLRSELLAGGWLLGLLVEPAETYFKGSDGDDDAAIQALVDQRLAARENRDYEQADRLRDELSARGIELEDTREGTRWRRT